MNIRDICISLTINLLIISLLIVSFTGEGYVYGIPLFRKITYAVIAFSLINGLCLIKKGIINKGEADYKNAIMGFINISISAYLFISILSNFLFSK